jgi:hypothetical protein
MRREGEEVDRQAGKLVKHSRELTADAVIFLIVYVLVWKVFSKRTY